MADGRAGFNIILIGGEVTLNSGATFDTRQAIEGDEWDFTLREAMGSSEAYWRKAKEVADILLNQSPVENPWALVWAKKALKQPRPDGTFKRMQTAKFFDDAVVLTDRQYRVEGAADALDASRAQSRYRIVPHPYVFSIRTQHEPLIFAGSFHTASDDGLEMVGMRPVTEVLTRWPGATLVLPHTPLIESKVRKAVEWFRKGSRPLQRDWFRLSETPRYKPQHDRFRAAFEEAEALRKAQPFVIEDDLRFTFWVDAGTIRDPADLEAAYTFVASRYDLHFGLWDLARDELLRNSLLDPEPVPEREATPITLPADHAELVKERAKERELAERTEKEARRAVHDRIWPVLKPSGWQPYKRVDWGTSYLRAYAELSYAGGGSFPLVHFVLEIHKKQATLRLAAHTRGGETESFLITHALEIEAVAETPFEPDFNVILRLKDCGWDSDRDKWQSSIDKVLACVEVLEPQLDDLVNSARQYAEQELDWLPGST